MKKLPWIFGVISLSVLVWHLSSSEKSVSGGDDVRKSHESDEALGKRSPAAVRLIHGSFLITDYGKEGGSVRSDLEALRDTVGHCQTLIKDFDRYHLPGNPEIVRFLQGANPDKLAWIPEKDPFLNDEGELVDRHGMPVFFHRLSGMRFEYRSAGPDRRMWTADDVTVK